MSFIIDKLVLNFKIAKTTNDLIYKDKTIDIHNIDKSYKEMVKKGMMLEMPFKYGEQSMYIAKDPETVNNLTLLQVLYTTLTDDKLNLQSGSFNPYKILQNEIFNSLWIEGVRSSKKQIKQFLKNPKDNVHDQIARFSINYQLAYNFVVTTNVINEDNLFALYINLSKGIDLGEEKLDGFPYRKDDVYIGDKGKMGINSSKIKESIQTVFSSAELDSIKTESGREFHNKLLSVLVIHYLFELVHPYYDMNGRMGRLLALWYANVSGIGMYLSTFSESINHFKKDYYYNAFKKSDVNGFKYDVTYFVQSLLFSMTAHTIAELIILNIDESVKNQFSVRLSDLQRDVLMGIITKNDRWYLIEDFVIGMDGINQGQLSNALSQLVKWNILNETQTKPKEYKFNWGTYGKSVTSIIKNGIKKSNLNIETVK